MSISILTAQRLRQAAGFLAAPPGLFAVTFSATSFHALLRLWFWQLVRLICKIFSRRGISARRRVDVSSSLQRGCLLGLAFSILGSRQMWQRTQLKQAWIIYIRMATGIYNWRFSIMASAKCTQHVLNSDKLMLLMYHWPSSWPLPPPPLIFLLSNG